MKRILATLMLFVGTAFAEAVDLSAMSDEELKDLNARIESELLRRRNEQSTTAVAEDDGEILCYNDGEHLPRVIFESEEQLKGRLHKIELTTENWSEYLGDYYYPYEYVQTNNFGEVTYRWEERSVGFGFKEGYIGVFRDVGMKFTGVSRYSIEGKENEAGDEWLFAADCWTESEEEYAFDLAGTRGGYNVHLEDYECTATVGTIVVLEVPEEVSVWFLENPSLSWVDIYVGENERCDSDWLFSLYDQLNP